MRITAFVCITLMVLTLGAYAQEAPSCKFPVSLERLAAKAKEVVDVTMDANMLRFAGNFLKKNERDEAQARKMISNLKGLCVRSFEFDKEGEYESADVEGLRTQLRSPVWSRMVGVRSRKDGENVDVYLRMEAGAVTGLAVIAAEPKELTFVHIDGVIDPAQLSDMGGAFGIPKVEMPPKSQSSTKGDSK